MIKQIKSRLSWLIDESICKINVEINLDEEVFGPVTRYAQVIENLMSNAIKYRDSNKSQNYVYLKIHDDKKDLFISIEDNGLGIPKHRQGEVFKMFKRFHPQVDSGSGLGMAIVKKHIEYLGGEICFKSSQAGTTFTIQIPKTKKEEL